MSKQVRKVWDVASVKAELPDIKVKVGKDILAGRTGGRLNQFCSVSVPGLWIGTEAAWSTIVYCLNNDKPLVMS